MGVRWIEYGTGMIADHAGNDAASDSGRCGYEPPVTVRRCGSCGLVQQRHTRVDGVECSGCGADTEMRTE